ncbi:MAG: sulfatase-like hydrolase/transferase [Fuerstiella sp.]|nr:sulfatase-like hydrolase/transferase [Fuerstiella sp.]
MFLPRLCSCLCSVAFFSAVLASAATNADDRPNVVMIMTDNHGAWTLGCYGNEDIRTPNIDRLAREGTLFDNAFASNPVCSPTRATTLTGLLPSQHGVHCFLRGGHLQVGPNARCTLDEFTSLPEVLGDAGYSCGLVGKWHLGGNMTPQEGFDDYWITMPHGGTSTFYDAKIIENGKERTEPEYLTDFWTKHAVNFIEQRAEQKEKPFFLFLAYNGPYSLSRLLLKEGRNRHADFYRDKELPSFPREAAHPWQLHNRDYQNNPVSIRRVAAEVSGVDDGVGTVMATLKAHGLDENTVVIFLADQGWVGGHGGYFGMGDHTRPVTARDGMMKIPMIWRQPGRIAAGQRSEKLVGNYDVMPTLLSHLSLSNVKNPQEPTSPGKSFEAEMRAATAAAENAAPAKDEAVFYEFESLRCIRTNEWKYTHRYPNGPHELYDLQHDPDEFDNLHNNDQHTQTRDDLKKRLDAFYAKHALPKYDLWAGGGSQTFIYDGIEEELAQADTIEPPPLPAGFKPQQFALPDGFSAELVAGSPLVTHPTMGCFDDRGRLFVCDGAGVNMSAAELEENLPNRINMLEDKDGDGVFDTSTVFADKMTFPMGGAWHDGALYVASPPNIWRLEDTDNDGVADKRDIVVDSFGYTGNAASIHGCFFSPTGRMYWCDGYHGHEFKDDDGNVVSKRKGSYIFSCWPDGSDVRIHCGGGMDNPVEVDFTEEGDLIGTVNILYTRPRIDCLVHWQYGGAYPHREAVLDELKVTGELLGPIHKFGHVAISGTMRYRSGVMDHRWGNNFFATEFNLGKVVRLELERSGSTYTTTEREFMSCNNRDFHPTDVLEDADGSLLVIDTGGWFYRGCPTSQIAKPDVLGGIYRIRRDGMTTQVDPRGLRIDWTARTNAQLMQDLKNTRFAVREKAVNECTRRGEKIIDRLISTARSADVYARRNAIWAATQIFRQTTSDKARTAVLHALTDRDASIRQAAWHGMGAAAMLSTGQLDSLSKSDQVLWTTARDRLLHQEPSAAVRREAYATFAALKLKNFYRVYGLHKTAPFDGSRDREERHALNYALLESGDELTVPVDGSVRSDFLSRTRTDAESVTVYDQLAPNGLPVSVLSDCISRGNPGVVRTAAALARQRVSHGRLQPEDIQQLHLVAARRIEELVAGDVGRNSDQLLSLVRSFGSSTDVAEALAQPLASSNSSAELRTSLLQAIASDSSLPLHDTWKEPILTAMRAANITERVAAIEAAGSLAATQFLTQLISAAADQSEPIAVRLASLKAALRSDKAMSRGDVFPLLLGLIQEGAAEEQQVAAQLLGHSSLTTAQLQQVAPLLKATGPQQLVDLVKLFKRSLTPDLAVAFLDSLEIARSLNSLPMIDVSEVVKIFPQELHERANALLNRMQAAEQQKLLKLDSLVAGLKTGDAVRGQEVFFSENAKCATCHVVGRKGKRVGPDLTTIGANRSAKDLLESIVFPSSTLVRQYEPYTLVTVNGRSYSGLVIRDSAAEVTIQQTIGAPVTVSRDDIDELVPSTVSIMPKGLDEQITPQQIADLVSWMRTLK